MEKEKPRGNRRTAAATPAKAASLPRGALQNYGQGSGGGGGTGFFNRVKRFLRIGSAGRYDLSSVQSDHLCPESVAVVRSASERGGESPLIASGQRHPPDRIPSSRSTRRRLLQDKEEVVLIHSEKLTRTSLSAHNSQDSVAPPVALGNNVAQPANQNACRREDVLLPVPTCTPVAIAALEEARKNSQAHSAATDAGEPSEAAKDAGGNSGIEDDSVFEEIDPGYETLEEIRRKLQLEREKNKKKLKAAAESNALASTSSANGALVSDDGSEGRREGSEKRDRSVDYLVKDPVGMTSSHLSEESSRDSGLGSPHTDSPDSLRDNHVRSTTSSEFSEMTLLTQNELAEGLVFPNLSCFPLSSDPDLHIDNLSPGTCYRHDCGIVFSDVAPQPLLKDTNEDLYDNPRILFRKQSQKQCASETMMAVCGLENGKLSTDQPLSSCLSLPESAVRGEATRMEEREASTPPPLPARKYAESEACGAGSTSVAEEEVGEEQVCSDNSTLAHTEESSCLSDSEAASTSCDHTLGSPDNGSAFPSPTSECSPEETCLKSAERGDEVQVAPSSEVSPSKSLPFNGDQSGSGKRSMMMTLEVGPVCFIGGNKRNSDDVASNIFEMDGTVEELAQLAGALMVPSAGGGAENWSAAGRDSGMAPEAASSPKSLLDKSPDSHRRSRDGASPIHVELSRSTSRAKSMSSSDRPVFSRRLDAIDGAEFNDITANCQMKAVQLSNSPEVIEPAPPLHQNAVEHPPPPPTSLPPTHHHHHHHRPSHHRNASDSHAHYGSEMDGRAQAVRPKSRTARLSAPCPDHDFERGQASNSDVDLFVDPNDEPIHMSVSEIRQQMAQQRLSFPGPNNRNYALAQQLGDGGELEGAVGGSANPSREERRMPTSAVDARQSQDFLESIRQLKDCGWYWGPLSYDEAEAMLEHKPDGSFLVRDSSNENYILSISFKSGGCVHHTRIEHQGGMFSFWSQPESHGRNTIREFVQQAVENSKNGRFLYFLRPTGPGSPPLPIRLLYPVSRFCLRVASLQHICRFLILRIVRRDHIDTLPVPEKVKDYLREKQYYVETLEES